MQQLQQLLQQQQPMTTQATSFQQQQYAGPVAPVLGGYYPTEVEEKVQKATAAAQATQTLTNAIRSGEHIYIRPFDPAPLPANYQAPFNVYYCETWLGVAREKLLEEHIKEVMTTLKSYLKYPSDATRETKEEYNEHLRTVQAAYRAYAEEARHLIARGMPFPRDRYVYRPVTALAHISMGVPSFDGYSEELARHQCLSSMGTGNAVGVGVMHDLRTEAIIKGTQKNLMGSETSTRRKGDTANGNSRNPRRNNNASNKADADKKEGERKEPPKTVPSGNAAGQR